MDGRYLESMAQKFKNWGKTGFTGFYEPKSIDSAPILKKEEKPVVKQEVKAFVGSGKSNTPIPKNISCGIKSIKIDGELLSLPNFYEFKDIDAKTKLNYELLEFMFSAYSRHGLLEVKDLVGFVEKNSLKSLLVKPKQDANQTIRNY
jgi:hypothetical protein